MKISWTSLLFALGLLMGSGLVAQKTRAAQADLTVFGGWRFGGTFHDELGQSHTAEPSGSWGGIVDLFLTPGSGSAVELLFSRQETSVNAGLLGTGKVDLTLDHYQIGGLKEYEGERFRPFLAGLLGWSHVKAEGHSTDLFSMTMGGGAKYFLTPRLGLRGDLRGHLLFGNNNTVSASVGTGGGNLSFAGEVFVQGEVAGGVFLTFGGPRDGSYTPRPLDDFKRRDTVPF